MYSKPKKNPLLGPLLPMTSTPRVDSPAGKSTIPINMRYPHELGVTNYVVAPEPNMVPPVLAAVKSSSPRIMSALAVGMFV